MIKISNASYENEIHTKNLLKLNDFDFSNFYCSIVYSHCSNASYENEIHRVDSPFNEDSKNIIFLGQGGHNFGGGTARKSRENGQNRETYCYAN